MTHESPVLRRFPLLWVAQGRRCFLCGGRLRDLPPGNTGAPTRDHVKPKVKGGQRRRNSLMAHSVCNMRKGERDPHPCELLYLEAINLMLERRT